MKQRPGWLLWNIIPTEALQCWVRVCYRISDNDEKYKRLKNIASEGIIPVHPALVELGLIKFVESLKDDNIPRFWMNLTWTGLRGYGVSAMVLVGI